MHSIRTKFTMLTVCAIIIAMGIVTFISVYSIKNLGKNDADQLLYLMCKTGSMNLESYFQSVEKSVQMVTTLVQESFEDMPIEQLGRQVERARYLFGKVAYNTNGVLTYYLRIDPEISDTVKGFWYVNTEEGFQEHEVTDITQYDTNDTSALVWFTIPKATGKGIWLPPYITDNLGAKVISYNEPVYWNNQFVGVIGIEIDYATLAHEVENIRLYNNGYAFILDEKSNIIYHPLIDSAHTEGVELDLTSPDRILRENYIHYTVDGVEKEAAWLPLSNGMRLYVSVPLSEINSEWQHLIERILAASLIILLLVVFVTMRFAARLTQPLNDLTEAAKQVEQGNYDFTLEYDKEDEVGILTHAFRALAANTQDHIRLLNNQVYVDALTSVRNKGAYADYIQKLQDQMDAPDAQLEFGIGVFDCDNLKQINDNYGHDKGDEYIKATSRLICGAFKHSPVFRIGGDEFAVILQNDDLKKRETLICQFEKDRQKMCEEAVNRWEQIDVAFGMAVYDPENDPAVIDVARRADQRMYENKRFKKGVD